MVEKSSRPMTLRELLVHADRCSRDLSNECRSSLWLALSEMRDLSRPVRRRSSFPTLLAMENALNKLQAANEAAFTLADYLYEQLQDIRERAKNEQLDRSS